MEFANQIEREKNKFDALKRDKMRLSGINNEKAQSMRNSKIRSLNVKKLNMRKKKKSKNIDEYIL